MRKIVSKVVQVYKKYGFSGFIKKLINYIRENYLDRIDMDVLIRRKSYRRYFSNVLKKSNYDRIVIWRGSFGYQIPLFQRPQHVANQLAAQNTLVFYEANKTTDHVKRLKKYKENLYLMNFDNIFLEKILMKELDKAKKQKYLLLYSTEWKVSIKEIKAYVQKGFRFIYEYVDHLSPELTVTGKLHKNMTDRYDYVMSHNDTFVVTTADVLLEDVVSQRGEKNVIMATNGVDYQFFRTFENHELDQEFQSVLKKGKPIVCYYGALAHWFDYELIKKIDETDKYSIVLFGVKYDATYDQNIKDAKNIYFFGSRDYSVLKYYADKCDVLTIPFMLCDITKSTSPVKLFEYMALHKPIVTTDLHECRKYKSVFIGHTHEEFIALLDKALEVKADKSYIELLDKEARANDWSEKVRCIIEMLRQEEKA